MDHSRPSLRLPSSGGGSLLDGALAKREDNDKGQEGQSYRGHVTAVYDAWCGLKDVHAGLIARVAARYGLTVDRAPRSSLLCVALHDVGKLSRNFQAMMLADGRRRLQGGRESETTATRSPPSGSSSEAARDLMHGRPDPRGGPARSAWPSPVTTSSWPTATCFDDRTFPPTR